MSGWLNSEYFLNSEYILINKGYNKALWLQKALIIPILMRSDDLEQALAGLHH